jgi:hypothetical protein
MAPETGPAIKAMASSSASEDAEGRAFRQVFQEEQMAGLCA